MFKDKTNEDIMNNIASVIVGVCIFLGLLTLGKNINSGIQEFSNAQRTVVVKGLAESEVLADSVIWPVVFRSNGNNLDEIYASIESGNAKVKAFLLENDIDEDEIIIMAPTIEDKNLYSSTDNKPVYNFSAQSTITVKSDKVEKIAEISKSIIALVKDGVALETQASRIVYNFNGLNDMKPKMIENATKNARDVAEKFAKDSESNLGKIKKANQGLFSISTPNLYQPELKKIRVVSTVEYFLVD